MELYFLRHGKAVEPGGPDAPNDFSRVLTPKGIEEMEVEATAFEMLGICPDVILTSPLLRAKQTAEIAARRLGLRKQLIETDLLAPGCDLDRLKRLIDQHSARRAVMLVGHEPDFSRLVGDLIGPNGAELEMKKAGLALVTVDKPIRPGGGVLNWLLPPRVLRSCAGLKSQNDD